MQFRIRWKGHQRKGRPSFKKLVRWHAIGLIMTRRENFESISKAYYEAYKAQASCLNKTPLSYEEWLDTDKSKTPGFKNDKNDTVEPNQDTSKNNEVKGGKIYKDLEETYNFLVDNGLIDRGTFNEFLECMKKLQDIAKDVEKKRGPAPSAVQFPKMPKTLNQDEEDDHYNYPHFPVNDLVNKPRETIYVRTPEGEELYGDQAKQWLRSHGNDNPFSWFSSHPLFRW